MFDLSDLLAAYALEPLGGDRYRAPKVAHHNVGADDAMAQAVRDVIPGGQLLGQAIVAATRSQPGKEVKTVHAVFARTGRVSEPLELKLETVHAGGSFGTASVTFTQRERPIAVATVLLHVPEPDLIRHAVPVRDLPGPDHPGARVERPGAYEVVVADGGASAAGTVGPPELPMWVRFAGAPADGAINQALLAFATNFQIITTALRPHAGYSLAQAHVRMSTGVISHTITFHEPVNAGDWLLLDQEAPYAGRGRTYGRGNVFTREGSLVASFIQDAMIRALPERGPGPEGARL